MDLKNFLLLSFFYFHAIISELALSTSEHNVVPLNDNDDKKDCLCLEQSPESLMVPYILDQKNNEIERLVIFVYRTADGKIYTYIPNGITQSALPDLRFKSDDSITNVRNEQLRTIFSNNNKSIKYRQIPAITKTKLVNIGRSPEDDNEAKKIINKQVNIPSTPKPSKKDDISAIAPVDEQVNHSNISDKSAVSSSKNKFTQINYGNISSTPTPLQKENLNLSSNNVITRYTTVKDIIINSSIPLSYSEYNNYHLDNDNQGYHNTNKLETDSLKKKSPLVFYSPEIIEKQTDLKNEEDLFKPKESITSEDSTDFMTKFTLKSTPNATESQKQLLSDVTFIKWFNEQMKNIQLGQTNTPINFSTLERLIQKTLKRRGMIVSKDGVLKDSQGNILNMTNLHMRPLVIGDTLDYNRVVAHPNDFFTLPSNTSYMEALLITLLDPPKIVAIVPLAKITLPIQPELKKASDEKHKEDIKTIVSSETKNKHSLPATNKTISKSLKKESKKQNDDKISTIIDFKTKQRQDNRRGKTLHPKVASENKNADDYSSDIEKLMALLQEFTKVYKKKTETEVISDKNKEETETERREKGPSKSLKKKRPSSSTSNKKKGKEDSEKKISKIIRPLIMKLTSRVKPSRPRNKPRYSEIETEADYTDHDFRIIGGAAATGSGNPISNRGRSGRYYSNIFSRQ